MTWACWPPSEERDNWGPEEQELILMSIARAEARSRERSGRTNASVIGG